MPPATALIEASRPAPEALHSQLWRASSLGSCSSPCLPSGFAALDAELPGGGWPTRSLSEIISPRHAVLEWRLLTPVLAGLCGAAAAPVAGSAERSKKRQAAAEAAKRPLLLINPPQTPHLPGLQACGLTSQQLVWIAADAPQQQLWATEQAIKSNAAAAILAWLPQARPEQIRRLQACALASDAPIFLFRPWAVQQQSSAAPLRLLLTPGAGWSLDVRILKRRGPACEGWLSLPSVPAELESIMTPRMLATDGPAHLLEPHRHALARPAAETALQR